MDLAILNILVSFGGGVLAGLGVGSGGIMVVYLTLALGLPQLDAQLQNLIFFVASSVAALVINLIKKRLIPRVVLPLMVGGCIFSFGASLIAREISSEVLGRAFGIFMALLGGLSLFFSLKSTKTIKKRQKYSNRTSG